MTRGDLEGVTVWERPIKPVALGMTILMVVLVVVNVEEAGTLADTWLARVVAVIAGIAAAFLIVGWVARMRRLAEWGLLASCVAYLLRSTFLFLVEGWTEMGVWLGLGAVVIAGGAYLLETWDDHAWKRR